MILLHSGGGKLQVFTWLPAIAVKPSLLQSSRSCSSMVMRGTRIIVTEPVTFMNSMGFQDWNSSTWRQKVAQQQHGHGLPKARRQSAEDMVWIIFIHCALQYVQLKTL